MSDEGTSDAPYEDGYITHVNVNGTHEDSVLTDPRQDVMDDGTKKMIENDIVLPEDVRHRIKQSQPKNIINR